MKVLSNLVKILLLVYVDYTVLGNYQFNGYEPKRDLPMNSDRTDTKPRIPFGTRYNVRNSYKHNGHTSKQQKISSTKNGISFRKRFKKRFKLNRKTASGYKKRSAICGK